MGPEEIQARVMAENQNRRRYQPAALLAIGALILTLAFGEQTVSHLVGEWGDFEGEAKSALLYEVEILAHSLDGVLRVADTLLEDYAVEIARTGIHDPETLLGKMLNHIPEGGAAWIIDIEGRPLASARGYMVPLVPLPLLHRFARSTGSESLIATVGDEPFFVVLRTIREPEGPRFILVTIPQVVLSGRISLPKGGGEEWVEAIDSRGKILGSFPSVARRSDGNGPIIEVETSFPTHTLRLRMARDIGPLVSAWRDKAFALGVFILAVFAGALFLGLMSLAAGRRAREAEEAQHRAEIAARETLFHEVNHRIKNNLNVVTGILAVGETEAALHPESAQDILRTATARVTSVALLHRHLYMSRSLEAAELAPWFGDLLGHLRDAYDAGDRIGLRVEAEAGLRMATQEAVPLGLIVTELVTNALKHGFPGGRRGSILLRGHRVEGDAAEFAVVDDGVGSENSVSSDSEGFGHELIIGFAKQIEGDLAASTTEGGGVTWTIRLPAGSLA